MAMVIYGTHVFNKFIGYYGEKEECENCGKTYKKRYVKNTTWAHLYYIPLFPIKRTYIAMCPICGEGGLLTSKEAKEDIKNVDNSDEQNLELYAKHVLENKPKGIFEEDISYEAWIKDNISGEEFCVATNVSKSVVNDLKKTRGYKNIKIVNV